MNRAGARGLDLPVVLLFVLFANAPDLDFVPGILLGDPGAYHHGISHSLGFALMVAVVPMKTTVILISFMPWRGT